MYCEGDLGATDREEAGTGFIHEQTMMTTTMIIPMLPVINWYEKHGLPSTFTVHEKPRAKYSCRQPGENGVDTARAFPVRRFQIFDCGVMTHKLKSHCPLCLLLL